MFCSLKKLYNLIPDSSGNKINPNIKTKQTNNNNKEKNPTQILLVFKRPTKTDYGFPSSSAQVRGLHSLGLL